MLVELSDVWCVVLGLSLSVLTVLCGFLSAVTVKSVKENH